MSQTTRRTFLQQTTLGAASVALAKTAKAESTASVAPNLSKGLARMPRQPRGGAVSEAANRNRIMTRNPDPKAN